MKKSQNLSGLLVFLLFLFVVFQGQVQAQAQPQAQNPQSSQQPPVSFEKVKGNIYEVRGGSGANGGLYIGENEVFLIDAKMNAETAKEILAGISELTSSPLRHIILTHSDGDHVNGLPGFPRGLNIISHRNTRKHMEEAFETPEQKAFLPNLTFTEKMVLYSGNAKIKLLHFGPAHTDGDAVVYFPEEKVAFCGDLIFIGRDPLIHHHKNGCSFGLVKTLKYLLELDAEVFFHGHGDAVSKKEIEALCHSIEEKQAKVKALIEEGKTLGEIKKAFGIEEAPDQPGRRRWPTLVEIIYRDLTEKKK